MILSHKHKFLYLRVPKSGSSTTQFMLRMSGVWGEEDCLSASFRGAPEFPAVNYQNLRVARRDGSFDENPENFCKRGPHATPKDLIKHGYLTEEQLYEYDCYAVFRNPYKRFLSGIAHEQRRFVNPVTFNRLCHKYLSGEGITAANERDYNLLTIPQYLYFFYKDELVVNLLDFRNFKDNIYEMLDRVGSYKFPIIPRMNVRSFWRHDFDENDFWTEETLQLFEGDYARDLEFYKEIYGEEALNRPVPNGKVITREHYHYVKDEFGMLTRAV